MINKLSAKLSEGIGFSLQKKKYTHIALKYDIFINKFHYPFHNGIYFEKQVELIVFIVFSQALEVSPEGIMRKLISSV